MLPAEFSPPLPRETQVPQLSQRQCCVKITDFLRVSWQESLTVGLASKIHQHLRSISVPGLDVMSTTGNLCLEGLSRPAVHFLSAAKRPSPL